MFDNWRNESPVPSACEANGARVHGKLLRPSKWLEDEDGETVPTIRAKKIYITG